MLQTLQAKAAALNLSPQLHLPLAVSDFLPKIIHVARNNGKLLLSGRKKKWRNRKH